MQLANIPPKYIVPFAQNDSAKVSIPVTTTDPTRASQSLGFPPLTGQPPESGGVPPQLEDFNGAVNQIAAVAWWMMAGGPFPYDATFASNSLINGYPNGAVIESADNLGAWINTSDNNQVNPDTTGTGWVPAYAYGSTSLTGQTGGTTTLTPLQAAKSGMTVAGTLTSALVIVVPNWIKNWTVTNNTSGAFTVTVKTAAGSGIAIPQNSSPTRISCDGTNVLQSPENIAAATQGTHAMQLQQATGRVLNEYYLTGSGTFAARSSSATRVKFELVGGGGGGAGSATAAAGQVSIAPGGGAGAYTASVLAIGVVNGVAYSCGAGGTAGAAAGAGGNGGNTTLAATSGTVTANGGTGGSTGVAAAPPFTLVGGAGGTVSASGNLLNTTGAQGSTSTAATTASFVSGAGGASAFGPGGPVLGTGTSPGFAAGAPGAGGSGGVNGQSTAGQAGGAGGAGAIRVTEYA